MIKSDYPINCWVSSALCDYVPSIIAAQARMNEDYSIGDVDMSAVTISNPSGYSYFPLEVKSIKGGYGFKEDGQWRDYFIQDIYGKLRFRDESIASGTPVYFVNGTDKYGDFSKGKFTKLLANHACLVFIAADGLVLFSPKSMQEAFLGYAAYKVRHTTEFGKDYERVWETKAVLDLTKGLFIPCTPPKELLIKN